MQGRRIVGVDLVCVGFRTGQWILIDGDGVRIRQRLQSSSIDMPDIGSNNQRGGEDAPDAELCLLLNSLEMMTSMKLRSMQHENTDPNRLDRVASDCSLKFKLR